MDGKRVIKVAIVAYIIVGIACFGIGMYAEAGGKAKEPAPVAVETEETVSEEAKAVEPVSEETTEPVSSEASDLEDAYTKIHEADADTTEVVEDVTEEETKEASVLREGPYYQYRITSDFDLYIYDDPDIAPGEEGVIGEVPSGTTGYAIERGNRRTLIEYNGMYGFTSNTYTTLTEVSAEEYPDALKNVTWENAPIGEGEVAE